MKRKQEHVGPSKQSSIEGSSVHIKAVHGVPSTALCTYLHTGNRPHFDCNVAHTRYNQGLDCALTDLLTMTFGAPSLL